MRKKRSVSNIVQESKGTWRWEGQFGKHTGCAVGVESRKSVASSCGPLAFLAWRIAAEWRKKGNALACTGYKSKNAPFALFLGVQRNAWGPMPSIEDQKREKKSPSAAQTLVTLRFQNDNRLSTPRQDSHVVYVVLHCLKNHYVIYPHALCNRVFNFFLLFLWREKRSLFLFIFISKKKRGKHKKPPTTEKPHFVRDFFM